MAISKRSKLRWERFTQSCVGCTKDEVGRSFSVFAYLLRKRGFTAYNPQISVCFSLSAYYVVVQVSKSVKTQQKTQASNQTPQETQTLKHGSAVPFQLNIHVLHFAAYIFKQRLILIFKKTF